MRKFFSIVGIFFSCMVIYLGVQYINLNAEFVGGRTVSAPDTASSAPSYVDSGYASFGADFYTYVTNNAADAASAVHTVAANQVRIFDQMNQVKTILTRFFGFVLISLGGMGVCLFGFLSFSPNPQAPSPSVVPPVSSSSVQSANTRPVVEKDPSKPFYCEACGNTFTGWYQECPSCHTAGKMKKM